MPIFEMDRYEVHVQTYRAEADDESQAVKMLFDGNADPVGGSAFVEVAENLGLPADNYPELAKALRELGFDTDDVIPSIRDVRQVKPIDKKARR